MTTSAAVVCVFILTAFIGYLILRLFFNNLFFHGERCQEHVILNRPKAKDTESQKANSKDGCESAAESEDQWYAANM
jgi:hypothetical protein